MESDGTIEVDRPIDDVFRLTMEHVAEWSTIVVEDEVIHDKNNGGVGTTFRNVTEENGRRMEFEGVVTHNDPPFANAVTLTGKSFDLDVAYTFEDLGQKTRVTHKSVVRGKGFFKVMLFVMSKLMPKAGCDALNKELESLKKFCETHD